MAETEIELGKLITLPMEECVFYNDLGIGEIEYYGEDMNTPIKPDEVWYDGYRIYPETFYQKFLLKIFTNDTNSNNLFYYTIEKNNGYIESYSLNVHFKDFYWTWSQVLFSILDKYNYKNIDVKQKSAPPTHVSFILNGGGFSNYSTPLIPIVRSGEGFRAQALALSGAYYEYNGDIYQSFGCGIDKQTICINNSLTTRPGDGLGITLVFYCYSENQELDHSIEIEYSYEMREKSIIRNTFKDILTSYSTEENSGITANFNFSAANGEPFIGISLLYSFLTFYMYYIREDGTFFQVYASGWWLPDGISTPEEYKTISYKEDSIKNQEFLDWFNQNII